MEFMQDNASIHSAKIIKEWLQDHGIRTMSWPPYSPDLNPIEHAWAKLKEQIYQLDPTIELFSDTSDELRKQFTSLIEHAWEDLGQDYFDQLVRSMDHRVNAVLEVSGW
jgi:transposase